LTPVPPLQADTHYRRFNTSLNRGAFFNSSSSQWRSMDRSMVWRTMKHSELRNFGMSILSALDRSRWSASVSSRLTTTNGHWNRFDMWLDVPLSWSGCWRGKTNICPCQKTAPSFLSPNPSNSLSKNFTYQGLHTTLETGINRNSNKDYETAESDRDKASTEKSRRIV